MSDRNCSAALFSTSPLFLLSLSPSDTFSLSVHAPPTLTTHNVLPPGSLVCAPVSLFLTRSLPRSLPFTSLLLYASTQIFPPRSMQCETVMVEVTGSDGKVAIADNLPMKQPAQLTKQAG